MNTVRKAALLQKRRWRIRKKVAGTALRPRLSVRFSARHIYAQAVDDDTGSTLVFLSSLDPAIRKGKKLQANLAGAKTLGAAFAAKAKAAGLASVVFDRNGALYHGKVKTFADAAREGGLLF
jgi:large subunit ribosomal protein L18